MDDKHLYTYILLLMKRKKNGNATLVPLVDTLETEIFQTGGTTFSNMAEYTCATNKWQCVPN